jgi:Tfp pilus assembly protein PilV
LKNHPTNQSRSPAKRHAHGFALIEALVAFLVVAFGMMAITAFQYTLSRSSDVAKQRNEATRIAQREIERLRSFGQRRTDGNLTDANYTYVDDVVTMASPQTVAGLTTNTSYTMMLTVGVPNPAPPAGDHYRWLNVVVGWSDRTGAAQSVQLASIISDGAPSDLRGLGNGRGVPSALRPKNRNINIPYPAVNLTTASCPQGVAACSAFVPPPGSAIFTFNNDTGNVTQVCRPTAYTVTGISRSGTTATALASNHPFTTGMQVTIVGANPAGYNGEFTVTGAVTGVSFTYTVANNLASPATLTAATATRAVVLAEGMDLASLQGVTCTSFATSAYVLSGYIRFKTGNQDATRSSIADPLGLTDATRALVATNVSQAPSATTSPVLITSTNTGYAPTAYECYAQRQITVRRNANATTGTTDILNIADLGNATVIPTDFTDQNAPRFVSYMCIVTPSDHDNDANTPPIWSGEVTLNPLGWTFATGNNLTLGAPANDGVGAATGSARLCRFTSDYNGNGAISNGEHPRYYRQVSGALDNQNYLVVDGEDDCPGDVAINPQANNPTADDYIDTNTVRHQPSASAELSFRCASISGNNTVRCATNDRTWLLEAAEPTTVPLRSIPME